MSDAHNNAPMDAVAFTLPGHIANELYRLVYNMGGTAEEVLADLITGKTVVARGDARKVIEWDSRGDQGNGAHEWVLYTELGEAR